MKAKGWVMEFLWLALRSYLINIYQCRFTDYYTGRGNMNYYKYNFYNVEIPIRLPCWEVQHYWLQMSFLS